MQKFVLSVFLVHRVTFFQRNRFQASTKYACICDNHEASVLFQIVLIMLPVSEIQVGHLCSTHDPCDPSGL